MAARAAGRKAHGSRAGASHLHGIGDDREEEEAPAGASARPGLEPESHQTARSQRCSRSGWQHMLPMDAARPSIQDGSEARDEVVHACCESEGGSSEDSSAMCCCRGSSAESFAQLPTVQVRSAKAKAATRAGMARCGRGVGLGEATDGSACL